MGGTETSFPRIARADDPKFLDPPGMTEPEVEGFADSSSPDRTRTEIAEGIRDYHAGDWFAAEGIFKRHPDHFVARGLWNDIRYHRLSAQRAPLPDALRALALDAAVLKDYSSSDQQRLLDAIAGIAKFYQGGAVKGLQGAVDLAQGDWDGPTQKIWNQFQKDFSGQLQRLDSAFQELDPEMLAKNCLWLARDFRHGRLGGSAWFLAQVGAQHPASRSEAEVLIAELEGSRLSTEFVLSDLFDHGGTSVALNLLALAPTIGLTRRLWRARPIYALLAGGPIHWASTKSLMLATGYSGKILPESLGDFVGQMGASYLQAGAGLFLSHRFLWRVRSNPTVVSVAEEAETLGRLQRARRALKSLPSRLWWTTKTSLKVTGLTASNLGMQYVSHLTGMKTMTPRGLPDYARVLFPKTWEVRREVAQGYKVRKILHDLGRIPISLGPTEGKHVPPEPAASLDQWLSKMAPEAGETHYQMLFAELYEASLKGTFGLNVQRWIQKKTGEGDYAGANRTWEQKEIPIRVDAQGHLCLLYSGKLPCLELPEKKVP